MLPAKDLSWIDHNKTWLRFLYGSTLFQRLAQGRNTAKDLSRGIAIACVTVSVSTAPAGSSMLMGAGLPRGRRTTVAPRTDADADADADAQPSAPARARHTLIRTGSITGKSVGHGQ